MSSAMGERELQRFINCTQHVLGGEEPWRDFNLTQMLDVLASHINEDISLKLALGSCLGMGVRPFIPPWWGRAAWVLVFAAMLLFAAAGNLLVIWIVLAHRRMRTITNCFVVNLAIADLMMALLNGAPSFVFMLTGHWPFGFIACAATNFVANLTVAAGVFTLVAITVDRYVAIVYPLQHRLSSGTARAALASVWTASGLLALPPLLYSDTYIKKYIDGEREVCFVKWPDGSYPTSKMDYCYNIMFLCVTYLGPVSVMVVAYGRMSAALRARAVGEATPHHATAVRAKQKVVRMFVLVVLMFAVCWLPYHAYFVLVYHYQTLTLAPLAQHVYLAFYWFAMANAMFNPLIYYWMSIRFRIYFHKVLCCCRPIVENVPKFHQSNNRNNSFCVTQRYNLESSSSRR